MGGRINNLDLTFDDPNFRAMSRCIQLFHFRTFLSTKKIYSPSPLIERLRGKLSLSKFKSKSYVEKKSTIASPRWIYFKRRLLISRRTNVTSEFFKPQAAILDLVEGKDVWYWNSAKIKWMNWLK